MELATVRDAAYHFKHGFVLHNSAFQDACGMHGLTYFCACGASFLVEHVLTCLKGGFPSLRHNEIRGLTILMSSPCYH